MIWIAAALILSRLPAAPSGAVGAELDQDTHPYLLRAESNERIPVAAVPSGAPFGEGFYSFDEIANGRLAEAWKATGKISFTWPSDCSGFYVSRDYFLTALHCVARCLDKDNRGFASLEISNAVMNMAPLSQSPQDFVCAEASIQLEGGASEPIRAQVVAAGAGASIARSDKIAGASPDDLRKLESMKSSVADWALLRLSRPSEHYACVRRSELAPNELVYGIGYPASAERTHHSSDGRREYVTIGSLSPDGIAGDAWLAKEKTDPAAMRILRDFYGDRLYWSTSDAYMGMSGGGLFDAQGAAIGVYAVLSSDAEAASHAYFAGSNGYLKISHVLDEAGRLLGEERLHQAFACIR